MHCCGLDERTDNNETGSDKGEIIFELLKYHLLGNEELQPQIEKGLEDKVDSLVKHQLYTTYKSAPTEEEREKARQEYLDRQGITGGFRW